MVISIIEALFKRIILIFTIVINTKYVLILYYLVFTQTNYVRQSSCSNVTCRLQSQLIVSSIIFKKAANRIKP